MIEADGYPFSPKVKRRKELLSKLDPEPDRVAIPYPPPKPSAQQSHMATLVRWITPRQEREAFIHPVIDVGMVAREFLVAACDTEFVQPPRKPASVRVG